MNTSLVYVNTLEFVFLVAGLNTKHLFVFDLEKTKAFQNMLYWLLVFIIDIGFWMYRK